MKLKVNVFGQEYALGLECLREANMVLNATDALIREDREKRLQTVILLRSALQTDPTTAREVYDGLWSSKFGGVKIVQEVPDEEFEVPDDVWGEDIPF